MPLKGSIYERRIVLDHGFVRLVNLTGDSDLAIVRAARNSYDAAWRAGENEKSDTRLINYLWKNRHTTPFEAVNLTFEVKAPIFVFRQWHRHRTWSYNEVSARYTQLPDEFYIPDPMLVGVPDPKNKQARLVLDEMTEDQKETRIAECAWLRGRCENAYACYRELLATGWPRELARMILPVNTYSKMFATVDLHNLFKFLILRLDAHAQYEIRIYAMAILHILRDAVPVATQAFEANLNNG